MKFATQEIKDIFHFILFKNYEYMKNRKPVQTRPKPNPKLFSNITP